jgi:hypothetical protein
VSDRLWLQWNARRPAVLTGVAALHLRQAQDRLFTASISLLSTGRILAGQHLTVFIRFVVELGFHFWVELRPEPTSAIQRQLQPARL